MKRGLRYGIFLLLLLTCSLAMSQTIVQSKQCQDWTNFNTSYQCAFNSATTAGNSIIAMALNSAGGSMTVTDNASHSYTTDLNYANGGQRVTLASVSATTSAQTITVSTGTSVHWQVVLMEVLGTAVKDVSSTNDNGYNSQGTGGGPYTFTSGTATTTQANDLLIGWTEQLYSDAASFTFSDDFPWLLVQQEPIGGSRIAARNVSTIGTYGYTGTFSGPAGSEYEAFAALVAYKVAAIATPAPVLFFSDLIWGPRTGWEGSSTKGAAVTIWGQNLGTSGNVIACGQTLASTDATKVAEWAATTNPVVPRGLQRVTFWLNSSMSATCSEGLAVSSGWQTSNVLTFSIAAGGIYFIATDGNDTYNGLYSTRTGHTGSDGPFRNQSKFNPGNGLGDTQYIVYIRTGTYTTADPYYGGVSALIALFGPYGSATHQKALIGYPGEVATLDPRNVTNGAIYPCNYTGGPTACTQLDYFTWSKLNFNGNNTTYPEDAYDSYGQQTRFIGNNIINFRPTSQLQSGFVFIGASQYAYLYGNYWYNDGYDSFAHMLYIKSQTGYPVSATLETVHDVDVGWNEFSTPYSNDNHGGALFISRESAMPAGNYTNHIYVHHNYFHSGSQGDFIYIGDGSQIDYVYIYSNIFSGGTSTAGFTGVPFFQTGSYNIFVYNNTIYQVTGGDSTNSCMYSSAPNSNEHIITQNNICYGNPGYTMYIFESGGGTWGSTNDMFYNPTGSATFSGSVTRTNPILNQNPLFVSSTDYHLQDTSPAKAAGVNLTSTLTSLSGGLMDYEGKTRPASGAWDVGALQFAAAAPPAGPATAPSCVPLGGPVPQTVTCTNPNAGTTVMCYNTTGSPATSGNGSTCAVGSTAYTAPLVVTVPETLYVVAGVSGVADSSVVSYTFVFGVAPPTGLFATVSSLYDMFLEDVLAR